MLFSILVSANVSALVSAMLNIADDNGYNVTATLTGGKYIMVDTVAKTVTNAAYRGASTVYNLGTDMGAVTNALQTRVTTARRAVAAPRVVIPTSVTGANGTIRVGDKVVRVKAAKRSRFNAGTTDVVLTVTGFTASGKLILAGLNTDQYSAKKFAKVTLVNRQPRSGEKVAVIKESSQAKFKLGLNAIYTFRGVTVEGGSFILDGKNVHQYAASRFAVVQGL